MSIIINGSTTIAAPTLVGPVQPLLLDTYTGAAAAYSLRKLRTAYTGSAIRVRRESDNAEQDIGFDNFGNLNETELTTFVGATGGLLTTWYDQSGNARHSTQVSRISQPQLVASIGTVNKLNGKPSIYFESSRFLSNTTNLINTSNPLISVYSILNSESLTDTIYTFGTPLIIGSVATGSFYIPFRRNSTTEEIQFRASATNSRTYNTGVNFTTAQQLIAHNDSGSTVTIHRNNISILSNTSSLGTFSGSSGFSVGIATDSSQGRWRGNIQELIIWTSDQSSNRSAIESNINQYYNIY